MPPLEIRIGSRGRRDGKKKKKSLEMKKHSHRSGSRVFILPINPTVNYLLELLSVECFFKDFKALVFVLQMVEENC